MQVTMWKTSFNLGFDNELEDPVDEGVGQMYTESEEFDSLLEIVDKIQEEGDSMSAIGYTEELGACTKKEELLGYYSEIEDQDYGYHEWMPSVQMRFDEGNVYREVSESAACG